KGKAQCANPFIIWRPSRNRMIASVLESLNRPVRPIHSKPACILRFQAPEGRVFDSAEKANDFVGAASNGVVFNPFDCNLAITHRHPVSLPHDRSSVIWLDRQTKEPRFVKCSRPDES